MSAWHYKLGEEEHGPVSFAELVRLVRDGTLTESVPVRRNNGGAWVHAWTVPALFAMAHQAPAAGAHAEHEGARISAAPTQDMREMLRPPAPRSNRNTQPLRWAFAAAAALAVTLALYRWSSWRALRFPAPPEPGGQFTGASFPLYGSCSALECALLYFDLALAVGAIAWVAFGFVERRFIT